MRAARVAFCIAALMSSAGPALAQCRIEGFARAESGAPLAGATVRLELPDLRQPMTTTVAEDGRYAFENVKPGTRVHLVVLHEGRLVAETYALVTMWVEPVDLVSYALSSKVTSTWDLDPRNGPSGEVFGVVRAADGHLLPAARLVIAETTMTATSDSAGRYLLARLRSGAAVEIQASAPGFEPTTAHAIVPTEGREELNFTLRRTDARGEPRPGLTPLYPAEDTSEVSARPEDLAGVPSLGRRDPFRGLQFLPGVWGTSEASGELYVRGGTPGENLVTLDGFTLYPMEHVFGPFSALNPDAIEAVDLSKGTSGVSDGGRLSGVIRLAGRSGTGRATGSVDFSLLGTRAVLSLPLGSRASFLFAARRSFSGSLNDEVLDMLTGDPGGPSARDRAGRYSGGGFGLEPSSLLRDLNGRLEVRLSSGDVLSASVYDATEDANNSWDLAPNRVTSVSAPDVLTDLPADTAAQVSDLQTWAARAASAAWTRRWSPAALTSVSFGRSTTSTSRARSSLLTSPATALDYSFLGGRAGSNALTDSNRVEDTTLRAVGELTLGFAHAFTFGGEISTIDTDFAIETEVMEAETDEPTAQLRGLMTRRASGQTMTAFVHDSWRPFAKLTVSPGLRVTRYDLAAATYAEPRVSVSYELVPRLHLTGGWSVDHQPVYRIVYEDRLLGDREFWALADGASIQVPRSRQATAGWRVDLPSVVFGVQGYYKTLDGLTMIAPRLFPGMPADTSAQLLHHGTGTAAGVEVLVQREWSRHALWTAYTASRTEYTYPTLEADAFSASHDQRHEFKIADSVRIRERWSCSGSWVVATGRPYTPVEGAGAVWFPTGVTVGEATFGTRNSGRLPAYHRLDLSTEREFRLGRFRSTVGVTVFNVYDRDNVRREGYEIAGSTYYDASSMGRVVNAFARLGF